MTNPREINERRDGVQELTMGTEHTSVIKLAMARASALGWRVFQNVVGNGWTGKMESSWLDSKAGRCIELSAANFQPFGLLVPSQEREKKNGKKFGGGFDLIGWQTKRIMKDDVPVEGLRVAVFCAIDAKTEGYSTMSPDQKHFAGEVKKAGGLVFAARRDKESGEVIFEEIKVEDHHGKS